MELFFCLKFPTLAIQMSLYVSSMSSPALRRALWPEDEPVSLQMTFPGSRMCIFDTPGELPKLLVEPPRFRDNLHGPWIILNDSCTENDGPGRIPYKCLVPINLFPEKKLCSLIISKT
jgi:hypothetical protein